MAKVVFYEKPGCRGNARQKRLLIASGHQVEARNLLAESWTVGSLRPFFGRRPVTEWFNPSSPRVKSGEIKLEQLTPETALAMMLEDPLLIRRPLMEVLDRREAGFDRSRVDAWIGLRDSQEPVNEACLARPAAAAGRRCQSTAER